mgnify:CR=1 FL=1
MNFLAHIYLSGEDEDLMIGNFIADAIRGKQIENYSPAVQRGIRLHRKIDAYTDSHAVVAESKDRLRADHGKYAPVIVDVFYDHFLAANWQKYHDQELQTFIKQVHKTLRRNFRILPQRVQGFLPFMIAHKWLAGYARLEGVRASLKGLSRRSRFDPQMDRSVDLLHREYEAFGDDFARFFPDLRNYVRETIKNET